MTKELKFTDFTPEQLVGMDVLVTSRHGARLCKIEKVNKASFSLVSYPKRFDFFGRERGGDTWNSYSAELLTPERAAKLRKQWECGKEAKAIREWLKETDAWSLDKLRQVKSFANSITT